MKRINGMILVLCLSSVTVIASPLDDGRRAFVSGDYETALRSWRPLAEQGNARAQYNLGMMLERGLGLDKNLKAARHWYTLAARQGQPDAQYNLGLLYAQGKGVFRSDREAVQWWEHAAANGVVAAKFNLGVMYAYGMGTSKDPKKALSLWREAAEAGNRDAMSALYQAYSNGEFGVPRDPQQAEQWRARMGR